MTILILMIMVMTILTIGGDDEFSSNLGQQGKGEEQSSKAAGTCILHLRIITLLVVGMRRVRLIRRARMVRLTRRVRRMMRGVTSGLTYPNGRAYLARRLELSPVHIPTNLTHHVRLFLKG